MQLVMSEALQNSAATDLLVSAIAIYAVWQLLLHPARKSYIGRLWQAAFAFIAIASFFGAVHHGTILSETSLKGIWAIVALTFGITMALFPVLSIYYWKGKRASRQLLPWMIGAAVVAFISSELFLTTFLAYALFQLICMIGACLIFVKLYVREKANYQLILSAGFVIAITGAVVEAIRPLNIAAQEANANTFYHLIEALAMVLLIWGALSSQSTHIKSDRNSQSNHA